MRVNTMCKSRCKERAYLGVDEWYNTALRDNDITEKLVQPTNAGASATYPATANKSDSLLVIADGKLQVPRNNTLLLVVARRITREFENLSSQVLEHCGEID